MDGETEKNGEEWERRSEGSGEGAKDKEERVEGVEGGWEGRP